MSTLKYATQLNCAVANLAMTGDVYTIGVAAAGWEYITDTPLNFMSLTRQQCAKRAELLRLREKELLAPGQEPYQFETM